MKNKTYDIMKLVLLVPAPLVTCISAVSELLGWEPGTKIAAVVGAIATMLGYYLLDSSKKYQEALKQKQIEEALEAALPDE